MSSSATSNAMPVTGSPAKEKAQSDPAAERRSELDQLEDEIASVLAQTDGVVRLQPRPSNARNAACTQVCGSVDFDDERECIYLDSADGDLRPQIVAELDRLSCIYSSMANKLQAAWS